MEQVREILPLERVVEFLDPLFERRKEARQAAYAVQALLKAQSTRLSDLARAMEGGSYHGNYKALERFLDRVDLSLPLLRLGDEEAPFYIADVTELEHPYARSTEYVGRLSDGKTLGVFLLVVGRPFGGKVVPVAYRIFSEATLGFGEGSRNLVYYRMLREVKGVVGDRPLVLDRGFSFLGMYQALRGLGIGWVVRLNLGLRPTLTDGEGRRLEPVVRPGEKRVWRGERDLGEVEGNLVGYWEEGWSEALWVFTSLEPERGLALYRRRMAIEGHFRELKGLLGLGEGLPKKLRRLEGLVGLALLAYAVGMVVGETVREEVGKVKKNSRSTPGSFSS